MAGLTVSLLDRFDFNRVTQRRSSTMGLDVLDVLGVDTGHCNGFGQGLNLPRHARRSEANLAGAIIADGCTLDDREDLIAIVNRLFQRLEQYKTQAVGEQGSIGLRIERAAIAVGREHTILLVEVARMLRHLDVYCASNGGVAFRRASSF